MCGQAFILEATSFAVHSRILLSIILGTIAVDLNKNATNVVEPLVLVIGRFLRLGGGSKEGSSNITVHTPMDYNN